MKKEFLFVEQKNVVGVLEVLKNETLESARIFIKDSLVAEMIDAADEVRKIPGINEIMWKSKSNIMGFIDLAPGDEEWKRVYRINSGKPVFTECLKQQPTKIIYIE